MTDLETSPAPVDSWDAILEAMRRRYPGQKDSVLFCIHKLQQNPEITLRDFRAEAVLHGIPVAGRALHSARGLLGIGGEARKTPPRPGPAPRPGTPPRADGDEGADRGSIENRVVAAVRQIQSAASADAERMRAAIRQAIAILQRAIGE